MTITKTEIRFILLKHENMNIKMHPCKIKIIHTDTLHNNFIEH